MNATSTFATRLEEVKQRISAACERVGRSSDEVTLLAVSKTFPFSRIEEAYAAGQVHFGENYLQDCLEKISLAKAAAMPLRWHFIGHLQSNKVKLLGDGFSLFHGLDSEKLAQRLGRQAVAGAFEYRVLVQVNIGNEESKSGIVPACLFDFLKKVRYIEGLSIVGLMAIPPVVADVEESRPWFQALAQLFRRAQVEIFSGCPEFHEISMGMSSDFEVAVEEGATIVRVGSLLFGQRTKKVVSN